MDHAFKQFPELHKTIWKVAAIPIATKLHIDSFDYQVNIFKVLLSRRATGAKTGKYKRTFQNLLNKYLNHFFVLTVLIYMSYKNENL